ncbi:hypothetical protein K443DRAFT_106662, partial [Laccaria amethystina LaAM-08-1]
GPVFCSLGPVWLRSFSSHETGLPNTKKNGCMYPLDGVVSNPGMHQEPPKPKGGMSEKLSSQCILYMIQ